MNQLLFGSDNQCASYLKPNLKSLDRVQRPLAPYTRFDGSAVDELHDIKISVLFNAEVKYRRNVRVTQCRCGASFPQKSLSRGLAFEVRRIDDLQCNRKVKISVKSLEGDTHSSATQLPKAAIVSPEHFVLMISIGRRHGAFYNKPKAAVAPTQAKARRLRPECAYAEKAVILGVCKFGEIP